MPADSQTAEPAPPRERRGWSRRRIARRALDLAVVVALGPAIFIAVAAFGVRIGVMDWRDGFAAFAAWLSPRLALVTIATGIVALLGALFADFDRLWLRALLALSLTAATIGGYLWSRAAPAPPMAKEAPR